MTAREPLHLTSTARRQIRRDLRPRRVVYWPAGEPAPDEGALFRQELRWWRKLTDSAPVVVDVYRLRHSRPLPGAIGDWPVPVPALPVAEAELEALRSRVPTDPLLTVEDVTPEVVRQERRDPGSLWLDSPWNLSEEEADAAAAQTVASEHVVCGVREEHGRWQAYRGLGSHLVIVGTTDTREEAEALALAHMARAWLERVEQITEARCGEPSWGTPIPVPRPLLEGRPLGDPQRRYRGDPGEVR